MMHVHIFHIFRSELDKELETYENEQRSSAKNVEQFSLLTSEQVYACIDGIVERAKEQPARYAALLDVGTVEVIRSMFQSSLVAFLMTLDK
jgi:hypothetical protein